MALQQYNARLPIDGDSFYYRPQSVVVPTEAHKYIQTKWNDSYTWRRLAYLSYGDPDLYWLLMAMNNITNPYSIKNGDELRVLLPDFLNEVAFRG